MDKPPICQCGTLGVKTPLINSWFYYCPTCKDEVTEMEIVEDDYYPYPNYDRMDDDGFSFSFTYHTD